MNSHMTEAHQRLIKLFIIILLIVFIPIAGFATHFTWVGSVDSDWNKDGNWLPSGVPNDATDTAKISIMTNIPTVPAGLTLDTLTIECDNNGEAIEVSTAGSLTLTKLHLIVRSASDTATDKAVLKMGGALTVSGVIDISSEGRGTAKLDLNDNGLSGNPTINLTTKDDGEADGVVDLFDFGILAENFGKKVGESAPAAPSQGRDYSGGQLALKLPERLPHRGDTVEVDVIARDAWMKAYGFTLSYDRSLLKLMDVEEGDFLENTLFLFHDGRVLCASRSGPSRGDGVLLRLRFRVIGEGRSREGIALRDIQVVDGKGRLGRLGEIRVPFCTAPHRTRLLASFPNPFNSEVWMPFQLADDADVRVEIYDISGRVVRVLDLGRLPAGYYLDRSTAAYWDGRSDVGERVASGVYLYRFTAGSYSAIRKMVILK